MRLRPFLPSGPSCMVHRSQGATEEAHEHLGGEEGGGGGRGGAQMDGIQMDGVLWTPNLRAGILWGAS